MSENKSYKLAQYEIIQGGDGILRWESHAGLSGLKTGMCLIIGNVLVIGPSELERPGYLKREFLEHLNRLPPWDNTEYYCPSHVLYRCQTGARISFNAQKVGPPYEPSSTARNHAPDKRRNTERPVNQESYRKEAIGKMKISVDKTTELLKLWYRKLLKR
jgi:hypothetical protein